MREKNAGTRRYWVREQVGDRLLQLRVGQVTYELVLGTRVWPGYEVAWYHLAKGEKLTGTHPQPRHVAHSTRTSPNTIITD